MEHRCSDKEDEADGPGLQEGDRLNSSQQHEQGGWLLPKSGMEASHS
jgi:hypothetical protein